MTVYDVARQMCTVRYVGLFLEDPLVVPWPVVEHLVVQLVVEDPSCVKRYTERMASTTMTTAERTEGLRSGQRLGGPDAW